MEGKETTANTDHITIPADPIEVYAARLLREAVRLANRSRRGAEVDDIAQSLVLKFLAKADLVMVRYPEPERFARVALHHVAIAFDRAERVQRSEGVRLVVQLDGGLRPARRYGSGNSPVAHGIATEVLETVADPSVPGDERAAGRLDAAERLARCFDGIEPSDRRLLELADGHGYTVTELAELYGKRRETLSRRINRTRRQVRQNDTWMATSGQV